MRTGKLYWMIGRLPGEGKVAVVADSSMTQMLDEAVKDMGNFPGIEEGFPPDWCVDSWERWFKKWFGVVTKPRGDE